MQTSVAMTAFTSLNKFMRREVWHLADGPELNNVQQTSRASTLILITEQTTWLQSDALMKTFTSFLGFTPPESSDLRERNVCIVCVARNTKVSQGSINLFIDYYRSKVLPPFNSSYLIRTSPPPKKEENFIGNEWIRKTRRGCYVQFRTRLILPILHLPSPRDPSFIKSETARRGDNRVLLSRGSELLFQRDWTTWSGREF